MSSELRRRAVVCTCIAAMVAVLANSVWQWRKASGFGWSGLNVQIAAEFSDSGRQQRTRILIETVEPRSPGTAAGLRKGDGITELNGFDQNLGKRFRDLRAGEAAKILTDRDNAERLLRVVSPWSRPSLIAALLLNGAVGLISLLIGTFVYRKRPNDPRTYVLFVLTSLYAIVRFTETGPVHRYGLDPGANVLQVLAYVWAGVLFFPVLTHFFFMFPQPRPEIRDDPRRLTRLYAPAIVLGVAVSGTLIVFVELLPAESQRLTDAVAYLRTSWPSVARFEGIALMLGAAVSVVAAGCAVRASGMEYRACGWKGLLLRAPATILMAASSVGLLISIALRVSALVRPSLSNVNGVALVMLTVSVAVCLGGTLMTLWVVYPVAACVALWRNYRESANAEKRQLRWPLLGLVLAVAGYLFTGLTLRAASWVWNLQTDSMASLIVFHLREQLPEVALLLIPLSIALAVLRYRLMDIDVYVRKTIIYGGATGLLGLAFLLIVAGVGRTLSGGEWLPVAATLTAGVLFIPVRTRVQEAVDRKFYRRRDYPAALSRLSEHKDPQAMVDIVQEAIPARSAALWLASKEAPVYELRAATGGVASESPQRLPMADAAARLRTSGDRVVGIRRDGTLTGYLAIGGKLADTDWDEQDRNFLDAAATQIGLALDTDQTDHDQAGAIQRALLPAILPAIPGVQLSGMWQPARTVGGDYYDVLKLGETCVGLAIADVAGKGVAAALLMSNVQAALKLLVADRLGPAALCTRLNRLICSNVTPDRFVTFFYGVLDTVNGTLTYCNAGHNAPILLGTDDQPVRLDAGGLPLGIFPAGAYAEASQKLAVGSRLLLYTDGVIDAADHDGLEFGEQRLLTLLQANHEADAESLQRVVREAVTSHCRGVFCDDVTILAVTVGTAATAASA